MDKSPTDAWSAISSYFEGKHLEQLVRHQIDSFNHLIREMLPKTIMMFNPIKIKGNVIDRNSNTNDYHTVEIQIVFDNYSIYRPEIHENNGATKIMFPEEARARNFTYSSMIAVDLKITTTVTIGASDNKITSTQVFNTHLKSISIGKIPIMLRSESCTLRQYSHFNSSNSKECRFDPGGYFIINGSEKTVLSQERPAENMIFLFEAKGSNKVLYTAEIKSIPIDRSISPKHISMMILSKTNEYGYPIMIQIPRMKAPVPLYVIFRALGVVTDRRITQTIVANLENPTVHDAVMIDFLVASVLDGAQCVTEEQALMHMTQNSIYMNYGADKEGGNRKRYEYTRDVIIGDVLPHCNTKMETIAFLGHMANQLINGYHKNLPKNDRDSYSNKRLDTTGMLINNLYRNYFNKMVKDMQKAILREILHGSWRSTLSYGNIINMTNIYKIIKSITIENGIKRALSTGDFGIKNVNSNKVGIAQVLNRMTYISALSHLRRVNTPIDKSGKLVPPRQLHPSSYGFLCPVETPEGQSVGVVKNLAYMAHISTVSSSLPLYESIKTLVVGFEDCDNTIFTTGVKIFINGCWIGMATDGSYIYHKIKRFKHTGIINVYTSVAFDRSQRAIYVCNEAGRLCRPVFRVKNGRLMFDSDIARRIRSNEISWDDLLTGQKLPEAVIEYIDANEQQHAYIAMSPNSLLSDDYSHCEMHPSTIFGVIASCIPYPEYNQSPRLTYQCAMGKQAMGVYMTNFPERMDKTAYVLNYPSRPLVDTKLMQMIGLNKIPSGQQIIVAIMTHTGYNQEDSIIMNRGSIDRGMFHATIYHTEKDEDKKAHGDEEVRCRPDAAKTKGMRRANYSKLNDTGNMNVNDLVEDRDIIMGKVVPIKENKNNPSKLIKYEDQSRCYRTKEECYIDRAYLHRNGDGYRFSKVRIRTMRKPVVGDKFSSRGAQKGTVGLVLPEEDMPFTSYGVRPDIIINPHCMPSRMTIGQLKETLVGKVLVELGIFGDGTSFTNLDITTIQAQLVKYGYQSKGDETMYDGATGEVIDMPIFIGPTFYQRLKHMVNDKCHSRSIGPMVCLTRQPAEGRSRDGGLRFGEMERDCMISHGTSMFTKTRMLNESDMYETHVCKKCGMLACFNNEAHKHRCYTCGNMTDFACVQIPYSYKLLTHELMTMNIAIRMITC